MITTFLEEIKELGKIQSRQIRTHVVEKEYLIKNKNKCKSKCKDYLKRIDLLKKEQLRIKNYNGEFIDSQIRNEGILQRCNTLVRKIIIFMWITCECS